MTSSLYPGEHGIPSNGYPPPSQPSSGKQHATSRQSMDGRASEYPQQQPEQPAPYTPSQQPDGSKYSSASASTPVGSEYSVTASSARSFPEYLPRNYPDGPQRYHATPNGMAQPTSPSMPSEDAPRDAQQQPVHQGNHSNAVPIDPSIAQSSPTYPPQHYPSYPPPHHDMAGYHPQAPMYRQDYPGPYSAPPHMPYGHVGATGGHPLSTVYSFVPIPGTHQQKRPRRRYEEIERMYKCGWNGCEKAYGTLNHLNAHVTMQGHGSKRTPEEFKEIRKEWKARKKEEENQRKQEEERQRQQAAQQPQGQPGPDGHHNGADGAAGGPHTPASGYSQGVRPQLPPLGYAPANGQVATQYGQPQPGMDGMPQYPGGQMQSYSGGYPPHSPYGQANQI